APFLVDIKTVLILPRRPPTNQDSLEHGALTSNGAVSMTSVTDFHRSDLLPRLRSPSAVRCTSTLHRYTVLGRFRCNDGAIGHISTLYQDGGWGSAFTPGAVPVTVESVRITRTHRKAPRVDSAAVQVWRWRGE